MENLNKAVKFLQDGVKVSGALDLYTLDKTKIALVIIDMINGFTREGALKSPLVEAIIPQIDVLLRKCGGTGIKSIAFGDCHSSDSPEFDAYPPHCIHGTHEAEMVDELKKTGGYTYIAKASTNGAIEPEFDRFLIDNPDINTFIVTGDCTDICVMQFCLTVKTMFNRRGLVSRVIVPQNAVATFDAPGHDAELSSVVAFYILARNGIETVKNIN